MADERLKTLKQTILAALVAGLEAAGITVPERRYTHDGQIAYDFAGDDCASSFIVSWAGTFQGVPPAIISTQTQVGPNTAIKCSMPLQAQFIVALTRCVPTLTDGIAPSAEALQASSDEIDLDAMTLPVVAIDKQLVGELTDIQCSLVGIGSVLPIGPFGALGGVQMSLVVSLV